MGLLRGARRTWTRTESVGCATRRMQCSGLVGGVQGLGVLGMSFRVISLFILILVHMVIFVLHSDGAGHDL
jgi:uncharacterized membrane protein